jgi:photosystem II stability/assembly factor-like uncharacterized protein
VTTLQSLTHAALPVLFILSSIAGCGRTARVDTSPVRALVPPTLMPQQSGTSALLQAVSAVSEDVAWVSGHDGTYARTTDGGQSWAAAVVPGADTLQFRDVHAVDARTAYLLSAGSGELSRIYKTIDGGASWTLQWVNEEPQGFYDCLDFWDAERGAVYGDAIDGELRILTTTDGGRTWGRVPASDLPVAVGSEGGFAASGTCLTLRPGGLAWIGTGAGERARALRTSDWGRTWEAADLPIVSGRVAGAFSITFWDDENGMVFGGDLNQADAFTDNITRTHDGGRTWSLATRPTFPGAVYGGTHLPGTGAPGAAPAALLAVGPGGAAYSLDAGATWAPIDQLSYWGVGVASPRAAWIVGPEGRITKVSFAP